MEKIEKEFRENFEKLRLLCYEKHSPEGMQTARDCVCGRPGGRLNNENCKALYGIKELCWMYLDLLK